VAKPVLMKGWTDPITFRGRPPAIPAEQLVLFPRKTLFEFPVPEGKEVWAFVQADNRRRYYLKVDRGDRALRASEWLAYRIADLVGVPTPRCDFIQTNDGDIAFGSEAVDGASKQAETILYLERYTMIELGSSAPGLCAALSGIHALDLFINNVDRHVGNFLVAGGGDDRQLLALDYARSFFWQWPWNGFFNGETTSAQAWVALRERHGFDLSAALTVVDRIGLITVEQIANMLNQMPTHWLSQSLSDELLAYCGNGGWTARVELLRKGLEDGSIV